MSFETLPRELQLQLDELKKAARLHASTADEVKKKVLHSLAKELLAGSAELLKCNQQDLDALKAETLPAFRDRLLLNPERIKAMSLSLQQVAELTDPVNEVAEDRVLKNGLKLKKVRAPLGFIFMIFESRPNVITEAFSLAFKSGNVILLRGGSESKNSSAYLYRLMGKVLSDNGFTQLPFMGLQDYDRGLVEKLLQCKEQIDVVVPRGGDALIAYVQKTSLIPIIKNDRGMCHAYVDADADLEMAINIVNNGKTQRPGVCNSLETVLVHEKVAEKFLPRLYERLNESKVEWKVDEASRKILQEKNQKSGGVQLAQSQNWDTEYLDQVINCRIVSSLDQALEHIAQHGSKHSEVIITRDAAQAKKFIAQVDAAAVYWNASTRFTDGFEFGLGGELGISTQKLHVRGPVGLKELTSLRWIIEGTGQVRA